jgi:hypothetical protein
LNLVEGDRVCSDTGSCSNRLERHNEAFEACHGVADKSTRKAAKKMARLGTDKIDERSGTCPYVESKRLGFTKRMSLFVAACLGVMKYE